MLNNWCGLIKSTWRQFPQKMLKIFIPDMSLRCNIVAHWLRQCWTTVGKMVLDVLIIAKFYINTIENTIEKTDPEQIIKQSIICYGYAILVVIVLDFLSNCWCYNKFSHMFKTYILPNIIHYKCSSFWHNVAKWSNLNKFKQIRRATGMIFWSMSNTLTYVIQWTLWNKPQWNLNQNSNIFIQENVFESVVCETVVISSWPQCVN